MFCNRKRSFRRRFSWKNPLTLLDPEIARLFLTHSLIYRLYACMWNASYAFGIAKQDMEPPHHHRTASLYMEIWTICKNDVVTSINSVIVVDTTTHTHIRLLNRQPSTQHQVLLPLIMYGSVLISVHERLLWKKEKRMQNKRLYKNNMLTIRPADDCLHEHTLHSAIVGTKTVYAYTYASHTN